MATSFGNLLRQAGAAVTPEQVTRFVRAVALTSPATIDGLYWAGRVTLVSDRAAIEVYDRVFGQVFRGLVDPADSRGDTASRDGPLRRSPTRDNRTGGSTPTAGPGVDTDDGEAREVEIATASREERLATTDFAELTDDELRELRALMRHIRLATPLRPARRHHRHRRGDRLDLRATLRRSRRSCGDPVEHVTRRVQERPRRLVVLCDISGSMAPYSRACIQLLHAATRASGSGSPKAEVFTFATRLTRLTKALAVRDPDRALEAATTTAPDWRSGTRIGSSVKEFLDRYGRPGVARGAVVVVVSDGWDRDDPELLSEQMARLSRLAHRIVWVNPRTAAPGFVPLAGGMTAALPHCDAIVSGHTLVALRHALSPDVLA